MVDDDKGFATISARLASTASGVKECGVAYSGPEAVEAFRKLNPQLAIVDFDLGEPMNGVQTIGEMQKLNANAIYALRSGRELDDEDIKRAIENVGIRLDMHFVKIMDNSLVDIIVKANKLLREREPISSNEI